jgi:hypothetical protein
MAQNVSGANLAGGGRPIGSLNLSIDYLYQHTLEHEAVNLVQHVKSGRVV